LDFWASKIGRLFQKTGLSAGEDEKENENEDENKEED
jgi:hypothetical protein